MGAQLNRRTMVLVLACIAAACSKSTEGPVPTSIQVVPGGPLVLASLTRRVRLVATVLDQNGDSIPSASVSWTTASAAIATVDTGGNVTARSNGSTTITATFGAIHRDVSCQVAQAAASVVKLSGDGQVGTVGAQLPQALLVRVLDSLGSAIPGLSVGFSANAGSGTVSSPAAMTDVSGDATDTWTLGTTPGFQYALVSVSGVASVQFVATSTADVAHSIAVAGGNNQSYAVNNPVPVRPSVKVTDQYGNPVSGAAITFSVIAGGGSVTGAIQSSDAVGIATVGSWILGPSGGPDSLKAAVNGTSFTTTFAATAQVPTAPASVAALVGDGQTGLVGYALNVRPAVKVTDAGGLPVASATVTFAVASGGGSVSGGSVATNAAGIAQVGSWIVGGAPGANSLTATVGALTPVTFNATAATGTFQITLFNVGPALSPAVQAAFDSAVAKWQRIIYVALTPVTIPALPANACFSGQPPLPAGTQNNVMIMFKIDSIDGPGKILGFAGPCLVRSNPDTRTALGEMVFDSADMAGLVSAGSINSVILHEMGHVLGFGSLWPAVLNPSTGLQGFNCLQLPASSPPFPDTYYSCPRGRAAFDSIGGVNYTGGNKVPVENCAGISGCGAGTYNAHWREATFFNEAMTGFLNSGVANPLSVMSVAAMEDEGYVVNYAAADAYSRTFSSAAALMARAGPVLDLGDDVSHGPVYAIDRTGHIVARIR